MLQLFDGLAGMVRKKKGHSVVISYRDVLWIQSEGSLELRDRGLGLSAIHECRPVVAVRVGLFAVFRPLEEFLRPSQFLACLLASTKLFEHLSPHVVAGAVVGKKLGCAFQLSRGFLVP